ncbi:MAG: hypothetical protein NZM15_09420 [Flavobacteriales bacterium]|nr:hypothetical protein [Flavobacteriales bacterium]MDW8432908.1 hypothetical protein [Flavobacteriales bacterium]
MQRLKKNNALWGLALGLLLPLICYSFIHLLDQQLAHHRGRPFIIRDDQKFVISVILNILSFRLYMVTWKLEQTGKGILGATFLYAIFYVVYFELMGRVFLIPPR